MVIYAKGIAVCVYHTEMRPEKFRDSIP